MISSSLSGKADFNYADSIPVTLQWVLTEWKTDPATFPFSGKGREILRIDMPTGIHGMQEITFNRFAKPGDEDYGLLYIGIGDGGSAEIGHALVSEIPDKLWGSIIRIDPSGNNSKNGKYGIPRHNPFYKTENEKNAPEIYAWGFRNPHRISWSKSGQLLAVNIGEHNIEALNIIKAGHFYGWPIREGTFVERFFNDVGKVYTLPSNDSIYHVTYPVAQFDHDEGTAISGGFEYRGTTIPGLAGKYVFGDLGTGRLFFVNMKDLGIGRHADELAAIRRAHQQVMGFAAHRGALPADVAVTVVVMHLAPRAAVNHGMTLIEERTLLAFVAIEQQRPELNALDRLQGTIKQRGVGQAVKACGANFD